MTDLLGGVMGGVGGLLGGVVDTVSGTAAATVSYVARDGDTLAGIADAHGVPLSAVIDANPALAHLDAPPAGAQVSVPLADGDGDGDGDGATPPTPASFGDSEAPAAGVSAPASGLSTPGSGPGSGLAAQGPPPVAGEVTMTQPGGASWTPGAAGDPPATGVAGLAGAVEWRLLAQAAPRGATGPSTEPPSRGAAISPLFAEALRSGGERLPPELQAPSAARLAEALQRLGWAQPPVATGRPGEVVILMRPDGLHAVRLGFDESPGFVAGTEADEAEAALVSPPGQPPGVDVAAPRLGPGARPGEDAAKAGAGRRRSADAGGSLSEAWVARVLPSAKAVKARWGVPAGVTVAHGALASDWGRHAPGNDFFGLDALRARGGAATPVRSAGRALGPVAFASLDEAAQDFGATLSRARHLGAAFRQQDATAFAAALARGGFGGPRYAERMDAVIALNGFAALD